MTARSRTTTAQKGRPKPRKAWWRTDPPGEVSRHHDGEIVCADALDFLKALSDGCADVVFLDPPFNLGKKYGSRSGMADRLAEDEYAQFMEAIVRESARILKDGGSLYLYHIPRWALTISRTLDGLLQFRHWIAISMKNGFARGTGLYPAHYALLHYSKGKPSVANRPKVPAATCTHCGEYLRDYGGYKQHIEAGVNLSDVWEDLSPVRHRKFKSRTANELPVGLPRRALEISGRRGGVLVDPFCGSGTSLVAARLERMRFVANDRELENVRIMNARLADLTKARQPRKEPL